MLLPMFSEYYSGYHYYASSIDNSSLLYRKVLRCEVGSYIAILMAKLDSNNNPIDYQVFFYNFK